MTRPARATVDGAGVAGYALEAMELTARGHRFYLHAEGDGDPVVLIHSSGLEGGQWRRLSRHLRDSYRVLVPDLLGSGRSPRFEAGAEYSVGDDVAVVQRTLELAGAPAHLVGHSFGGLLALLAAREAPTSARSLALFEPVAWGVLHGAEDPAEVADALAELAGIDTDGRFLDPDFGGTEAWMARFVDYWNRPGHWRQMPELHRDAMLRVAPKVFAEVRAISAESTPASAYAATLRCPTLLLRGDASTVAARRVCELLARALPAARLEAVEGGHLAPLTHADAVNAAISAHLRAGPPAGSAP